MAHSLSKNKNKYLRVLLSLHISSMSLFGFTMVLLSRVWGGGCSGPDRPRPGSIVTSGFWRAAVWVGSGRSGSGGSCDMMSVKVMSGMCCKCEEFLVIGEPWGWHAVTMETYCNDY